CVNGCQLVLVSSTAPFAYNTISVAAASIVAEDLGRICWYVFLLVLFSGSIPPELGELGALEVLDLCWNKLSGKQGAIPPDLGGLGALKVLNLRSSRLSGKQE
ncbi:unnamed protein product, partial [Ectocarpus sp. 6 AP-2014]